MKLYNMNYKEKMVQRQGFIEASSIEKAEELGREWCREPGRMFISVKDAVLLREEVVAQRAK
jgi:hypothetical protein